MDTVRTMIAVTARKPGGPEALELAERPVPQPGPGQILVRVEAAGVNRPDILQRQGVYPPPKGTTDILGLEIAGRVVAAGGNVQRCQPGDAVCALVSGGGYAEYCVADASAVLPVPDGVSMVEAASLPETFFTVAHNVFDRGRLRQGEIFLVHGGTSGIGVAAIQLAYLSGARVFATAGSDEKCHFCEALGAERGINYTREDFVEVLRAATGGHGADVILDMVGGDYLDRNIRAAAEDGRIVQIAFQRGSRVTADFMRLMLKRLTLTGSTLRIRPPAVKASIARRLQAVVWPWLAKGRVKAVVDKTFPLAEAAQAHAYLESGQHMGKIVLTVA
jgi:NADPH2:quinone reductase